jgi:2-(1,2-epoxy-1,2-dihydrophenyl)acetyl-CoA isomerase
MTTEHTLDTHTDMVHAKVADGVGIVTLNRPQRRNALHPDMYDAIIEALECYANDTGIGCVLITGAGTAFCAGGDVRAGLRPDSHAQEQRDPVTHPTAELVHAAQMVRLLHEMPQITIAALPGPAVGAGMSIALSTDLRIAAQSASLIPGWGKLAFSGDFGGAWFLTRLVGPSRAMHILLDGAPIAADTALQLGLFNKVVEDADLPTAALGWARSIAAGPTTAWQSMKANVAEASTLSLEQALPRESERMVRSRFTEEHRRAVRTWLDAATMPKTEATSVV